MARIVHHHADSPIKIDPNLKPGETSPLPNVIPWPRDEAGNLKTISICACGLSKKFPFCDGTHKQCKNEEAGMLYRYDPTTKQMIGRDPG